MTAMLKILNRIVQEVSAAPSLAAMLDLVVERINVALHASASSIFLLDTEAGEYVLAATVGLRTELIGQARVPKGLGIVGMVGEREELINLEDATAHAEFHLFSELGEESLHGFLGAPIMYKGCLHGVIVVQLSQIREFEQEQVAFLLTLTAQISPEIALAQDKGVLSELGFIKRTKKKKTTCLKGLAGGSGVAIGKAVVVYPPADLDAVPDHPAGDIAVQIELFTEALNHARQDIQDLRMRSQTALSVAESALFDAYLKILDSRTLYNSVVDEIKTDCWAQSAIKRVIQRYILEFEALDDAYLRERAADFQDLGRRILSYLQQGRAQAPDYPKQTILVGEEVSATALVEVPEDRLVGVVSAKGASNSHLAILARALGVPIVLGTTGFSLMKLAGTQLIVDGYNGDVYLSPTPAIKKEFQMLLEQERDLDAQLNALRDLPAQTKDKTVLSLYVNTGLLADGGLSLSVGADGIGLYRTEMPFMMRDRFPGEEEQRVMYRQLLSTFSPRPVTMRTLDVGGDKKLPYFPVEEENPFLGWRGIRISLDHPEIFLQQLRAMLHANDQLGNLSIMLPMITSTSEVDAAKELINQAYQELQDEGIEVKYPMIGLMIEVPSAAYQTYDLAQRVDFLSVGSNDLIQYLLAVDRNNPRVANLYDGLHPAVLRALRDIVNEGHRAQKKVSICGELAGNPLAVLVLIGLGFDALSMNARSLLRIKWVVRSFSMKEAKRHTQKVLEMDNSEDIKVYLSKVFDKAQLGGLIRAGN